jgi:type II secretory pathway pseudopilin PulG
LAAYAANQENANDVTLEASAVAQAVRDFMTERATWIGTATELLGELAGVVNEKTMKQKTWPGSGQALSNDLRRLTANLEAVGIATSFGLKVKGRRALRIEQTDRGEPPETEREAKEAAQAAQAAFSASQQGESRDTCDDQASQASPQAASSGEDEPTLFRGNSATRATRATSLRTHSVSGDAEEEDDGAYDRSDYDTPVDAVPTCQDCGAVIESGQSFCVEHDPRGA